MHARNLYFYSQALAVWSLDYKVLCVVLYRKGTQLTMLAKPRLSSVL